MNQSTASLTAYPIPIEKVKNGYDYIIRGNHYGQKKNYNWNKIRKEFQESDLTYSTFSTQKGIPKSTAYAHLKDLIAIKNSSNGVEINNKDTETFDFVPIEVLEAEAAAAMMI